VGRALLYKGNAHHGSISAQSMNTLLPSPAGLASHQITPAGCIYCMHRCSSVVAGLTRIYRLVTH
jgi:hypothetical protein